VEILSVDGGATKTIAVVYNEDRTILGVGVSGSTNFRNVGISTFKSNMLTAIKKAEENAHVNRIDEYTFALAGMKDSKKSSDKIMTILNKIIPNSKISYYNDGEAGFYSRFPEGKGIVVAPGTGMVAYGMYNGKKERSSGWGWFLDDEGSAFNIGMKALRETTKSMDGRDERSPKFKEFVRNYYGLSADRDLINIIHKSKFDIRGIALLAKFVSGFAAEGDVVAKEIMNDASAETANAAISLYKRLGKPEDIAISGYGGVLRAGEWYWNLIKKRIDDNIGKRKYKVPLYGYEAIIGSIVMRSISLGFKIGDDEINSLRNQLTKFIVNLNIEDRREYLLL
jgi:N-acetylglucosamine kinase